MSLIELTSEQKIILNEIRKFTKAEVEPVAGDIDKAEEFPFPVIEKLDRLGFLGAIIPEQYEGAGLDTTSLCIIIEELARTSASVAAVIAIHNCFVAYPMVNSGSQELQNAYCKKLASGAIGGYVLSGSLDAVHSFETAVSDSTLVITGVSDFVMNGTRAGILVTPFIMQDKECYAVFDGSETLEREVYPLLGLRSAGITRMKIEKLEVPIGNVIGNTAGIEFSRKVRAYSDLGLAAISLGIAEACCEAAVPYSKERKQFKRAICEFPMVQEMLVDMRVRTDAARLLVYNAARSVDRNESFELAAHTARLFSDDTAVFCGTTAVQVLGGYGYTKDYPVERFFRDAKTIQAIGHPVFEIKAQIAKEILS